MPHYDWSQEKAFARDPDGCLLWRGTMGVSNHPIICQGKKRQIVVRRALMAIKLGRPLKRCERVYVECRKARCCSFDCMRIGTQRTITRRAYAEHQWNLDHDRRLKISRKARRRWTPDQVDDMRKRHFIDGESRASICQAYGAKNLDYIFKYECNVLHLPEAERLAIESARAARRRSTNVIGERDGHERQGARNRA